MNTSVQSLELQSLIAELRAKCANQTITLPEMREAVRIMRGDRYAAQKANESSGKGKKKPAASAEDMLKDLFS